MKLVLKSPTLIILLIGLTTLTHPFSVSWTGVNAEASNLKHIAGIMNPVDSHCKLTGRVLHIFVTDDECCATTPKLNRLIMNEHNHSSSLALFELSLFIVLLSSAGSLSHKGGSAFLKALRVHK